MKPSIHLLVTSIGRRVELVQAFRSAANRLGIKLTIIGADISDSAPALFFCDKTVIVPRISSPDYIPFLLRVCAQEKVDALVPTIDTDLLILSRSKSLFADIGTTVFVSAPEKISICRDKRLTSDYFVSLGLHAPTAVSDISQYTGGFPAFIKPIDGSSSIGANRADTYEELQAYASQLPDYVIQPFATGTEYTIDIFCDQQGNPIYITPRIRLVVRGGEVLKTQIRNDPVMVQEMLTLISDFKPCGGITVQLIHNDQTGINQYIEINPRFGGGAPLSMKAGADAAEALLRLMSGQVTGYLPNAAAEGAVYSRFDQCVCIHPGSSTVNAVIFDLDDTLFFEKDYVRSGYRQVASLLPQIADAEAKLWEAFCQGKPAIDTVLAEAGLDDPNTKQLCLNTYRNHMPNIQLRDGVLQLLHTLKANGVQLGILTDGRPEGQRNKLQALGLYDLVDHIIITDELGGVAFRKPNDIAFRILQTRFNVPYGNMLYVGDNPAKDFQACRALGMQYLYLRNTDGLYSKEAGFPCPSVDSFEDAASYINKVTV